MTLQEIADGLVSLCRQGKFREAMDAYYADDIITVEAQGDPRELKGIDACRGKAQWFDGTFETLDCQVEGPWLNDPCFLAKFSIKVRQRETGEESVMDEYALYSVHDGKVVHERFF